MINAARHKALLARGWARAGARHQAWSTVHAHHSNHVPWPLNRREEPDQTTAPTRLAAIAASSSGRRCFTVCRAVYDPVSLATAAAATSVAFTPLQSAIGGAVLGVAVAGKLRCTGRVLGISGTFKGLMQGDSSLWRFAFLGGMAAGSLAVGGLMPEAFEAIPSAFPMARAVVAGLLVGYGSALSNGCTSGHGICGNARLSKRSMAATATFMTTGVLAASLTGTLAALGVAPQPAALAMPTPEQLRLMGSVAAAAVASFAAVAFAARRAAAAGGDVCSPSGSGATRALDAAAEAVAGATFAAGLVFSGMVRPSKVVAFLSPLAACWDPSLAFVMGAALLVATPAYQAVLRAWGGIQQPLLCKAFSLPTATQLDAPLLVGSALFGMGWGLSGICPGPGMVAGLQTGAPQIYGYLAAMLAGMALQRSTGGMWVPKAAARA